MASYHFVVYGNPMARKSHRSYKRGNFIGNYDPSKEDKKNFAAIVQQYAPRFLITGGVELTIYAYFDRPKKHFRTGKFSNELRKDAPVIHIVKPDSSNILKFIEDALSGIFWKDDCQIYKPLVWKLYDHEKPRVEVFINTV